jgi:FecCD transport family.
LGVVFVLARAPREDLTPVALLLAGVAFSSLATAVTAGLLLINPKAGRSFEDWCFG